MRRNKSGTRTSWITAAAAGGVLAGIAVPFAIAGVTTMGVSAPAVSPAVPTYQADDAACSWLGWAHPACAGGAFDSVPDDGIPGDNAAIGGIPAPALVPNTNGTMSLPGVPGAV
ncbi:hypothetical protein [Mycolicibacterium sp. 120270]|uniref:hypothetical protein n=1 Tax=Mycolicibacterium sp. 120270 TaxID=3090600 RepID=UPI00299EA9E9|nr:hypothetical protein [Mycolicibacterium sp. 120270]MDX1885097.1 hypothetical protein [Mycolicibacterium sp. 120270]